MASRAVPRGVPRAVPAGATLILAVAAAFLWESEAALMAVGGTLGPAQGQLGSSQESGRRIAVVTAYYGTSLAYRNLTWPNKRAYAQRWGYHVEDLYAADPRVQHLVETAAEARRQRESVPLELRSAGHNDPMLNVKLHIFAHCARKFLRRYDWIFWTDADAIFLNFSVPLAKYLPVSPTSPHRLLIAAGPPGSTMWRGVINTGQFFMQASAWTLVLMQKAARHAEEPCDPTIPFFNGWMEICIGFTPDMIRKRERQLAAKGVGKSGYPYKRSCCEWGDQGALMQTIQKAGGSGRKHVRYDGFREYNSHFPYYGAGDLVLHMPGSTTEGRVRAFTELLALARHSDGTFAKELSTPLRPQQDNDHLRGMDYSTLGGSAGGDVYATAADVIREVRRGTAQPV